MLEVADIHNFDITGLIFKVTIICNYFLTDRCVYPTLNFS